MYPDSFSNVDFSLAAFQAFLPRLLGAIVVIIIGVILAWIANRVTRWIVDRSGIYSLIRRAFPQTDARFDERGIGMIAGKTVGAYVFLVMLRQAVASLGLTDLSDFLTKIVNYVPNVFFAVLIGFIGIHFARLASELVVRTLGVSDAQTARFLAAAAKFSILFLTVTVALDHLKLVNPAIITTVLSGIVGMAALAGGIAFGL